MDNHWLARATTIRLLWILFIAILVSTVLLDTLVVHHSHFGIDGTFGFGAWFGFASCAALVLFAKLLGAVMQRPDHYYDR